MSDSIENFKSQFFHANSGSSSVPQHQPWTHLNNAGVAPISRPAFEAVSYWSKKMYENGIQAILEMAEETEKARKDIADFLNCAPKELAFMPSCAAAISQVALGLSFQPGDEIIIWDQEYPSNFYPWRIAAERSGAKLVVVNSADNLGTPVDFLVSHITAKTKAIAFSWVQYRTGAITDLQKLTALARTKGIFTCADVIQGVGLLPFDFSASGLDAACGGSHKWLVSPIGCGLLSVREENLEKLSPVTVGAITFGTPEEGVDTQEKLTRSPKTDSQRFEPGSKGFLEILALAESVKLIKKTGVSRIAQEVEWLSSRLMHGLRELGYEIHSPHGRHHHFHGSIVNFSPGEHAPLKTVQEVGERLKKERIQAALRPPGVRLAPHAFNCKEEIDFVLQVLSR